MKALSAPVFGTPRSRAGQPPEPHAIKQDLFESIMNGKIKSSASNHRGAPDVAMMRSVLLLALLLLVSACSDQPRLKPLPRDGVILAFGDSLTFGTGASRDQSYPAVLSRIISRTVINAGVPGEVSAGGLKRLPGELDRHHPQLLIVIHGGNDILRSLGFSQAADNIHKMIEMARDRGIDVVMLGVPRPGLILSAPDFYEEVAAATGTPIDVDAIADILQYPANKSDGIHPNARGYQMMAERIQELLKDAGAI
jgi:acyl-CoA thioesterase-1